jgi:hypothetical protein
MPLCCPVCKAENANAATCRRCKADLGMLHSIEEQRANLLAESRRALDDGRFGEALAHAHDANLLRQGRDSQQWLAILNLLTARFGEAWGAYQSMNTYA